MEMKNLIIPAIPHLPGSPEILYRALMEHT